MTVRMLVGDIRDIAPTLEPASVDLVLTSPPFLSLRAYLPADHPDKAKEIGSEPTPGASAITIGWTECACPGEDKWRPGLVLDPFGGTGTVGAVTNGHGRDALLIDLDERNLELTRARLGFFLNETTEATA